MLEGHFLGVPDVNLWAFIGLILAAFATSVIAIITGTAGGLLLLGIMTFFFPPSVLVPLHTAIMLLIALHVIILFWRHILRATILPFFGGSIIGATLGAQIFVALPAAILQGIIGFFILIVTWIPKIARTGGERKRFAIIGFGITFLGMFVSATGTLLAPFVASAAPDRRNHVGTMGVLMTFSHIAKITAFGFLGIALHAYIPLIAMMVGGAAFGNWLGRKILDRMPEQMFRRVFQLLLTVLGLRLLWIGAESAWPL